MTLRPEDVAKVRVEKICELAEQLLLTPSHVSGALDTSLVVQHPIHLLLRFTTEEDMKAIKDYFQQDTWEVPAAEHGQGNYGNGFGRLVIHPRGVVYEVHPPMSEELNAPSQTELDALMQADQAAVQAAAIDALYAGAVGGDPIEGPWPPPPPNHLDAISALSLIRLDQYMLANPTMQIVDIFNRLTNPQALFGALSADADNMLGITIQQTEPVDEFRARVVERFWVVLGFVARYHAAQSLLDP